MTLIELVNKVAKALETNIYVEEDADGQIVIYTDLRIKKGSKEEDTNGRPW
jgi:hypothetical protein